MSSEIEQEHKLHSIFQGLKSTFGQKLSFLKVYLRKEKQWDKSAFLHFRKKFLKKIKSEFRKGKEEEDTISSLVGYIDGFIKKELSKNPMQKKLKYSQLKSLIVIAHQTKALIALNVKQLKLIEGVGDNAVKFNLKSEELLRLISEESKVIQEEESLQEFFESTKIPSFKWEYTVVGYGSLMNSEQIAGELCAVSAKVKEHYKLDPKGTIRERLIPVLVFSWKRVFFRRVTSPKWTLPRNIKRKALAAMDLQASHKHYFNAVAIKVSKEELKQLYKREIDYKLTKLSHVKNFVTGENIPNCICFKSPIAPQIEKENAVLEDDLKHQFAYLGNAKYEGVQFHATKFLREGDITPPPKYFEICVQGAKGLDPLLHTHGMYDTFLDTTYLYYLDRVLSKDRKVIGYKYYGLFSVREFLKLGYKLKGAHVLPIQFR